MSETEGQARSWTNVEDPEDYARIAAFWADADLIPRTALADLFEIAHDQLTAWLAGRTPKVGETSLKTAEMYVAMDQWASLRGGQAQTIGPDGFAVTVSTWQLVLKARDLLCPPEPAWTRLG